MGLPPSRRYIFNRLPEWRYWFNLISPFLSLPPNCFSALCLVEGGGTSSRSCLGVIGNNTMTMVMLVGVKAVLLLLLPSSTGSLCI